MSQSNQPNYLTAGLHINHTGEITSIQNAQQLSIRLSPVNKRVLLALLAQAGKTVSRQQLFDTVWPNQVISDDALTRCISDLRAQLKIDGQSEALIQTIPKVGYRWLPVVELTHQATLQNTKPSRWKMHLKSMALALVMLWVIVGAVYWWSKPDVVPLVILNTTHTNEQHVKQTTDVAAVLKKTTLKHEQLRFLSQHALDAHQGSPFPFFSHEFGVRWFVASHLITDNDQSELILNLIDAKTALVIYSDAKLVSNLEEVLHHCQNFLQFVAGL